MNKNKSIAHFTEAGVSIVFMSTSGVLGKHIDLPVPVTIWVRCVIAGLALAIVLVASGQYRKIEKRDFKTIALSSILLALHWITYFFSLRLSSVAIGMLSLFTYPLITALLEPVLLGSTLQKRHLFLAPSGLAGIYFLAPDFNIENDHTLGLLIGISSAFFYSIRNILLKRKISGDNGLQLMCLQLILITLLLWPVLMIYTIDVKNDVFHDNWRDLLLLGLLTTALGHTLFVRSFAHFSITTISIFSNLTPLCGILLGFLFLKEAPQEHIVVGGAIIMSTAIYEGLVTMRKK